MRAPFAALIATFAIGAAIGSASAQQTVKLTTVDWCPYTCKELPDGGFNAVVVREAFKAMGYDAEIEFLPWQRAVNTAKSDSTVAGYFPEYPAELEGFLLSPSIGRSPLGLAVPAGQPAPAPDGLAKLRLGVVNGYVNAKPVADAIAAGLKPEGVSDDATNIRKVAAGRIDAAEIDQYVLDHLLRTSPDLKGLAGKVAYATTLEDKTLHIAFTDSALGRQMADVFAQGLKKIDVEAMQQRYLSRSR